MSQTPAALRDLTRHLHAQGRLRVWSVIVTILGEIAQPEGGKISMASLLEICAALNIEPQAVRTAMSRLSKDGLVAGKREGRTAHYQFSPQGLAEYCRAATVIYAAPKSLVDWVFAFAAEGADAAELQKTFASNPPLVLGGRCYVWPAGSMSQVLAHSDADFMVFDCQPLALSNWAKASVLPALNAKTCQRIGTCCQDLRDGEMTPDQARVARVLLIHFWRRLVLRYPTVQAPIPDWPLGQVQRDIAGLYPKLLRISCAGNRAETRFQ